MGNLGTLRATSYVFYPRALTGSKGEISHTTSVLLRLSVPRGAIRHFPLPVDGRHRGTLDTCSRICVRDSALQRRKGGIYVITRKSTKFCSSVRCMCSGLRTSNVPIGRVPNVPTFVTTNTLNKLRITDRRRQLAIVPNVAAARRVRGLADRGDTIIVVGLSEYASRVRHYVHLRPRCQCRCFRGMNAPRRGCVGSDGQVTAVHFPCFSLLVVHARAF